MYEEDHSPDIKDIQRVAIYNSVILDAEDFSNFLLNDFSKINDL